jgi:hypothetical protein
LRKADVRVPRARHRSVSQIFQSAFFLRKMESENLRIQFPVQAL